MCSLNDLFSLKSKSPDEQESKIRQLSNRLIADCNVDVKQLANLVKDGVLDLSDENETTIVNYCLVTILASDVATVINPFLRRLYVDNLVELSNKLGINYERVVYISGHADKLLSHLSAC